jgi:hypothetical protein
MATEWAEDCGHAVRFADRGSVSASVLSPRLGRLPDNTHAAFTDLLGQTVVQQLLSGFDGHFAILPMRFVKQKSTSGHGLGAENDGSES